MSRQLTILLEPGWIDASDENPDGPPTYMRTDGNAVLQFSFALYRGGNRPDPTESDLINLAVKMFSRLTDGTDTPHVVATTSGPCAFGTFGSAEGRSESANRARLWVLSNGLDFVMITFISTDPPTSQEWDESHDIALRTTLGPDEP
jgi:hypothetical protein